MSITGQLSARSGHYRSKCGCVSVIRVPMQRPFPPCPMCLRATSWQLAEEPRPAPRAPEPARAATPPPRVR